MKWETVIGLEAHVELSTQSKLFCGCSTAFGAPPNSQCCPVCLGLPGALPTLNERAVEYAVRTGLALGCDITRISRFDRKNYFYPDLPKAYQITQFYHPIARGGTVQLPGGKRVELCEIHMEEDAGKLMHDSGRGIIRVDYNRCGIPLLEIVTKPDLRSGDEAAVYLEQLRSILQYLEVSDCKIQEGSLRCDVNLSVRPAGSQCLGTRTEMKNLGSLRAVVRAVDYESSRQVALLETGGEVTQETRRWDEASDRSVSMRAKEQVSDYQYFPEPDLPPVVVSDACLKKLRATRPEFALARIERYRRQWGLSVCDAETLTREKAVADFFEETVKLGAEPKQAANWIMGPMLRRLSLAKDRVKGMGFTPIGMERLIRLVGERLVNRGTAMQIFDAVFDTGEDPVEYMRRNGLEQVQDTGAVAEAVGRVLAAHPGSVKDFGSGKEAAFSFLMGQAMRELDGRADPKTVWSCLQRALRHDY